MPPEFLCVAGDPFGEDWADLPSNVASSFSAPSRQQVAMGRLWICSERFSWKTPLDIMRDTTNSAPCVFGRFCIFHSWLAEWLKCKILYIPLEVQTARRPPSAPRDRGKKHFWCFGALWYDGVLLSIYEITSLWALEVGICLVFHINQYICAHPFVPNVLWREQAAILSGAVGVVLAVVLAS